MGELILISFCCRTASRWRASSRRSVWLQCCFFCWGRFPLLWTNFLWEKQLAIRSCRSASVGVCGFLCCLWLSKEKMCWIQTTASRGWWTSCWRDRSYVCTSPAHHSNCLLFPANEESQEQLPYWIDFPFAFDVFVVVFVFRKDKGNLPSSDSLSGVCGEHDHFSEALTDLPSVDSSSSVSIELDHFSEALPVFMSYFHREPWGKVITYDVLYYVTPLFLYLW